MLSNKKPNKTTTIAITGGIGSGKSVVSRILRLMDIPVFDCDAEAKLLYVTDSQLAAGMKALLGREVYLPDGQINRSYLASHIFQHPETAHAVQQLVHPAVTTGFKRWRTARTEEGYGFVGIESAILFEAGLEALADTIWLVTAPEAVRLQRAMHRDKTSEEQIRSRMAKQASQTELLYRAHAEIINDGKTLLIPQIIHLLTAL